MSIDLQITARLAEIAERLELLSGQAPSAALKRDVTITARLKRIYDALVGGALEAHLLTAHSDVDSSGATDGQSILFDEPTETWKNAFVELALAALTDTTITTPASGEFLRHDGTDWKNAALALGDLPAIAVADLSDTSGSPVANALLMYSAGTWRADVATYISKIGQLSNVIISSPANRDVLTYTTFQSSWINSPEAELIWAGGHIPLTGHWNAGDYNIQAEKFLVENTTAGASHDNVDLGINIITIGHEIGTAYNALNIDVDFNLDTSYLWGATLNGAKVHILMSGAGTYINNTIHAYEATLGINGQTPSTVTTNPAGFAASVKGNTSTTGVFGAYTQGTNVNASGVGYGYQGYGQNTAASGTGLQAIGVYGFAQATNGLMVGVQAQPFSVTNKGFAFYAPNGNNHFNNGVSYFYTATALQSAATTTHITPGTNDGSIYIEALLEVDGTAFFDGDIDHNGSNIGFFGTAPTAQAAAYTPTNVTPDRSYDANSTTVEELADVLGTLIADLQAYGLLQ